MCENRNWTNEELRQCFSRIKRSEIKFRVSLSEINRACSHIIDSESHIANYQDYFCGIDIANSINDIVVSVRNNHYVKSDIERRLRKISRASEEYPGCYIGWLNNIIAANNIHYLIDEQIMENDIIGKTRMLDDFCSENHDDDTYRDAIIKTIDEIKQHLNGYRKIMNYLLHR